MKRGGSLKRRSAKMQAIYETQRIPMVRDILQARPRCEAHLPGCMGRSTEVHEVVSRARGGSILDPANGRALCHACHQWITEHPTQAHVTGFSRHSWER